MACANIMYSCCHYNASSFHRILVSIMFDFKLQCVYVASISTLPFLFCTEHLSPSQRFPSQSEGSQKAPCRYSQIVWVAWYNWQKVWQIWQVWLIQANWVCRTQTPGVCLNISVLEDWPYPLFFLADCWMNIIVFQCVWPINKPQNILFISNNYYLLIHRISKIVKQFHHSIEVLTNWLVGWTLFKQICKTHQLVRHRCSFVKGAVLTHYNFFQSIPYLRISQSNQYPLPSFIHSLLLCIPPSPSYLLLKFVSPPSHSWVHLLSIQSRQRHRNCGCEIFRNFILLLDE